MIPFMLAATIMAAADPGPDRLTLLITACIAALPILYTAHSTRKARDKSLEVEKKSVDRDAYETAQRINDNTIARLKQDLDSAQRSIDALRRDLSDEQRENLRLREHIDRLEATVARLRARLGVAGLLDERKPEEET